MKKFITIAAKTVVVTAAGLFMIGFIKGSIDAVKEIKAENAKREKDSASV